MKALLLLLIFFLCLNLYAQSDPRRDPVLRERITKTINLIIKKDANALSKHIEYPIDRQYPFFDIKSDRDLIARFDELFDSVFLRKLKLCYNDSVIFEHNGDYGLVGGEFAGDLWFDYDGNIIGINEESERAETRRKKLEDSIRLQTHSSIRNWSSNQIVASSNKYLIRIDYVGDSLRYASWNKGKTQSDKPDLIIMGGKWEQQGTMGGWTWTFVNNGWEYVVDQSNMGESEDYIGLFLYINKNGKEKYKTRLTPLER